MQLSNYSKTSTNTK